MNNVTTVLLFFDGRSLDGELDAVPGNLQRETVGTLEAGIADAGIADAGIADAGIADAGIADAHRVALVEVSHDAFLLLQFIENRLTDQRGVGAFDDVHRLAVLSIPPSSHQLKLPVKKYQLTARKSQVGSLRPRNFSN